MARGKTRGGIGLKDAGSGGGAPSALDGPWATSPPRPRAPARAQQATRVKRLDVIATLNAFPLPPSGRGITQGEHDDTGRRKQQRSILPRDG